MFTIFAFLCAQQTSFNGIKYYTGICYFVLVCKQDIDIVEISTCLDCDEDLCQDCDDAHRKVKLTRNHAINPYSPFKTQFNLKFKT